MQVNDIMDMALDQTGSDISQFGGSYTTLIKYLNNIYRNFTTELRELNNNFFWQEFYADTVGGQSTYSFPTNMEKTMKVWYKQTGDGNFVEALQDDYRNYDQDFTQLSLGYGLNGPIYIIEDTTFSLFPAPKDSVIGGIKVQGPIDPPDLVIGGAESTILIEPKYHDILWMGMKQHIYAKKLMINEKNDARIDYDSRRTEYLLKLVPRNLTFNESTFPDLTFLSR